GLYPLEPARNARIRRPTDTDLVGKKEIAAERQIGDRQPVVDDITAIREMRVENAPGGLGPLAEDLEHSGIRILRERPHEPVSCRVARELVVVPQEPAQNLTPFRCIGGTEFTDAISATFYAYPPVVQAPASNLAHPPHNTQVAPTTPPLIAPSTSRFSCSVTSGSSIAARAAPASMPAFAATATALSGAEMSMSSTKKARKYALTSHATGEGSRAFC